MTPFLNPWRLAVLFSGSRRDFVDVSFASGGRLMHADVPANELWISVKDVLVIEEYELDRDFALGKIAPGSTVVDAGAFAGLFSLKVSPYARRVVALEASRRNFPILVHNLSENSITNVEARQCALSSSKEKVRFRDVSTHSSSSISNHDAPGSYEVDSTTLDHVVEKYGRIDLLKMDIEGAEFDVLLSTSSKGLESIRRIVAEMHIASAADQIKFDRVLARLQSSGMRVRTLGSRKKVVRYGLARPWRSSLRKFDGRSSLPYRMLVSVLYGSAFVTSRIKRTYEHGSNVILYASRNQPV